MRIPALVRQRTVWFPTVLGGCILLTVGLAPIAVWLVAGERILSADRQVQPEVLIVEGWIKEEPIESSVLEFMRGGYRYIVACGGYNGEPWMKRRSSDAEAAKKVLLRGRVPLEKIIFAQAPDAVTNRTFAHAVAASEGIQRAGLKPGAVTVFTRGAHARRTQLVYQKVFGPGVQVGVISWKPPGSESESWWHNSSRAEDFVKETAGCFWEWAFDSGRRFRERGESEQETPAKHSASTTMQSSK